jgi:hypothetical protein
MKNNQTKFAGVAVAALLAISGLSPVANAQLITLTAGNFTINANGYSASTIFAQAPGALPTTSAGGGGTLEDTWGIFQITSILDGATTVFDDNNGVEYWGMFYNSYDTSATPFGSNVFFTSQGLQLDIYKVNVADVGDAAFGLVFNQGTAGRIDLDSFTGLTTAGTLALSSALSGQMDGAFFGNTQTTSSNGNLGVTYNNLFDIGLSSMSELTFSLSGLTSSVPADWTVKFDGPIDGHLGAVPEPSTYGLMGAGALMGLVAMRRMKKRAQAV